MEMIQTLNVQLAMMMFFALMPMLGMLQARRARPLKDHTLHGHRAPASCQLQAQ